MAYDFTYRQEVGEGANDSLKPHHPSDNSGVTIGPGYDMKDRSENEVKQDMLAAGVDEATASRLSKGAGLNDKGEKKDFDYGEWADDNKDIRITKDQQKAIYNNVNVPEYEKRSKSLVSQIAKENPELKDTKWEDLTDDQKEIIFDYAYNPQTAAKRKIMTKAAMENDSATMEANYKRYSKGKELGRNAEFKKKYLDKKKSTGTSAPPNTPLAGAGTVAPLTPTNLSQLATIPQIPNVEIPALPEASLPSMPGFTIGFPAARLMDNHVCPMVTGLVPHVGGPIIGPCMPTVLIGSMPAATLGDMCICVGPPDSIVRGSTSVLIGNKPAARMFDNCAHGGMIMMGMFTVLIGTTPSPTTVMGMMAAISGSPFLDICNK